GEGHVVEGDVHHLLPACERVGAGETDHEIADRAFIDQHLAVQRADLVSVDGWEASTSRLMTVVRAGRGAAGGGAAGGASTRAVVAGACVGSSPPCFRAAIAALRSRLGRLMIARRCAGVSDAGGSSSGSAGAARGGAGVAEAAGASDGSGTG